MRLGISLSITQPRRRGGGGPISVTYGETISILLASDTAVTDADAVGIDGLTNWRPADGPLKDSSGGAVATTLTFADGGGSIPTRAVDDGSAAFDLMSKAVRASTSGATNDFLTLFNIPYAKYDIFVYIDEQTFTNDHTTNATSGQFLLIDGETVYTQTDQIGYNGAFNKTTAFANQIGGKSSSNVAVFRDHTAASVTLNVTVVGDVNTAFFTACGVQIRERLDGLTTRATAHPKKMLAFGDSYTAGVGASLFPYTERVASEMAGTLLKFPSSIYKGGVGGSTFEDQKNAIVAFGGGWANSALIWWDGHANGRDSVANYMTRIATAVSTKGDTNFLLILPVPIPADNDAAYQTFIDDLKAAVISTYSADNVYDPRPVIAALDPSDTSVGGLPASAFLDSFHLNGAAEFAVVQAVTPIISAMLE